MRKSYIDPSQAVHFDKKITTEVEIRKVIAFNGSPRKSWNTATLLNKALEGAASQGAETELVHLYDLNYKGCTSCFSCKLKGGKSYGRCALQDDLTPFLHQIPEVDATILGSPVYLGSATGQMRSFLERLVFPYLVYDANHSSLFQKRMATGFIFTMGAPESRIKEMGIDQNLKGMEMSLKRMLLQVGADRIMFSADYPYGSMARALLFLEQLPVSPADKERIAHGNAERLLRL